MILAVLQCNYLHTAEGPHPASNHRRAYCVIIYTVRGILYPTPEMDIGTTAMRNIVNPA